MAEEKAKKGLNILIVNRQQTYLIHDFLEGFTALGHTVKHMWDNEVQKGDPQFAQKFDNPERLKILARKWREVGRQFDLIISVNYWEMLEHIFPWHKTICLFVDPPHHFGGNPFRSFQTVALGPHPRIEWGVRNIWHSIKPVEPKYKALIACRIDKAQENGLYFRDRKAYSTFANRNWVRVAGVIKALKQYGTPNVRVLGEPADYAQFYLSQDRMLLPENEYIQASYSPYEKLHEEFNLAEVIIDHVRPEVSGPYDDKHRPANYNPKMLCAFAMGKPVKNIELDYKTGDVVLRELRRPEKIRNCAEFCEDLLSRYEDSNK